MKKFLALYLVPAKVIEDWSNTDADKRQAAEAKMREDWGQWTGARRLGAMDA